MKKPSIKQNVYYKQMSLFWVLQDRKNPKSKDFKNP